MGTPIGDGVDNFHLTRKPDGVNCINGRSIPIRDDGTVGLDDTQSVVFVHGGDNTGVRIGGSKLANVELSGSAALSQSPSRTMGSASGDRYASWCCQRCGDEIGWIGRAFGRILHHCKTPNVELRPQPKAVAP